MKLCVGFLVLVLLSLASGRVLQDSQNTVYMASVVVDGGVNVGASLGHLLQKPKTCLDIKTDAPSSRSGVYVIYPDGESSVHAYCEMEFLGGGFTLVQRVLFNWELSRILQSSFDVFVNETVGNPNPGNVYRLAARHWPLLQAGKADSENEHLLQLTLRQADYNLPHCQPLSYYGTGGTYTVGPTPASMNVSRITGVPNDVMGRAVADMKGPNAQFVQPFVTDHSCHDSVLPWFYSNCCVMCFAFGAHYWDAIDDGFHPLIFIDYMNQGDYYGRYFEDVCFGPLQYASTTRWVGADVLAYYIR